jgi:Holliday junction DNA helicase RuvA
VFSYIKGTFITSYDEYIEIDVGGLGFELLASAQTIRSMPNPGANVIVYTTMDVRDNEVSLIGFHSREEKKMYLLLVSVQGVGPRSAVAILSCAPLPELIDAILTGDHKIITSAKGIGKKTAERIVFDLSYRFGSDKTLLPLSDSVTTSSKDKNAITVDAIAALQSLGFSRNEAVTALNSVVDKPTTLEALIAAALTKSRK